MAFAVTDVRSNPSDQIAHAAKTIGRSLRRRKVFAAIYRGKRKIKTVSEVGAMANLNRIPVLQEGNVLAKNSIVKKTKVGGEMAYEKDPFYDQNKKKILSLAGNKQKLANFPTKTNPRVAIAATVQARFPRQLVKTQQITIDDIHSFRGVHDVPTAVSANGQPISEARFKLGMKRLLGEVGEFHDWGGERNDLFTTRIVVDGKRRPAAFAFKGPGVRGKLTPKHMGKNGDQIQRLFSSAAEIFMVQYGGQIDQSVLEQMRNFAIAASVREGKTIYFGVIDGVDTDRLIHAYPRYFS